MFVDNNEARESKAAPVVALNGTGLGQEAGDIGVVAEAVAGPPIAKQTTTNRARATGAAVRRNSDWWIGRTMAMNGPKRK
jgi:hypothetical protein